MRRQTVKRQSMRRRRVERPLLACGLMSGTSRDGIDAALVEITGRFPDNRVRLLHSETVAYPRALRAVLGVPHRHLRVTDVATLDFAVGWRFALAALRAIKQAGLEPEDITVIGSHGQTLVHLPGAVKVGREWVRSTLQVGNGAVIAALTGIPTVCDLRSADIAVGGEGAPLVPVYDYVTLRSRTRSRVALNIGGIANLTAIPKSASPRDVICFDTGPGNCVLDLAAAMVTGGRLRYDKDGSLARRGEVDRRRVAEVLAHPYFRRRPPKSTGWEEFGEEFTTGIVRRMARGRRRDGPRILRTLTEAVAESIAGAISKFVAPAMKPDDVIVTGGGAKNTFLMECLRRTLAERFPRAVVGAGEAFGIDSDAKEACAFAYLAYLRLRGIPGNLASQAAGLKPAVLGALYGAGPGNPRMGRG
jgi:anhydro-N-acetylmuramic acid kinase